MPGPYGETHRDAERAETLRVKLKITGMLLLTGMLGWSGSAHAGDCRTSPDRYCIGEQPQSMPVRIYRNYLVVANGQFGDGPGSENFILDTGTAPSIINLRVVRELGLATAPSTFIAVGKIIPAQTAVIPEIKLGPIRAVSVPVQVQNLSQFEHDMGIPISGVIGLDVLSKSSFLLDYAKKEIDFGGVSHTGVPVRFDPRSGIAVMEVRINGKEARLLVDTGSDSLVLFGGNFTEGGWLSLRNTSQSGTSLVDRKLFIQVFSAADIILGGQHFSDDRAYFIPGNADPVFDGLLGVRALGFRAISYDQADGTIYLKR